MSEVEAHGLAHRGAREDLVIRFEGTRESRSTHWIPRYCGRESRADGLFRAPTGNARGLTRGQTNGVIGSLSLLGKEVRHRQVTFAGVVVEAEHTRMVAKLRKLLSDRGQSCARRDANQHSFLTSSAARHFLGVVRLDLNHSVKQAG